MIRSPPVALTIQIDRGERQHTVFVPVPILELCVCAVRFRPDVELVVDVRERASLHIVFGRFHLLHSAQVPGVEARAEHHVPKAGLHDLGSGLGTDHRLNMLRLDRRSQTHVTFTAHIWWTQEHLRNPKDDGLF